MDAVTTNDSPRDVATVDPRTPRFGQAITAILLLLGVAFRQPVAVYAVAGILGTSVATRWQFDLYGTLWRSVLPVVGPPDEQEPAAPHRFAKLLGAAGALLASVLLLAGAPVAGYAIAGAVAAAAGFAAATDVCIGCRLYNQFDFARRLDVV